jgi:7-cyano-7-deazaguanine synthase
MELLFPPKGLSGNLAERRTLGAAVTGTADTSPVAVLFSGGLDSAVMLARLIETGRPVVPLYIHCQWHWQSAELQVARQFLAAVATPNLAELVELQVPLADLYPGHWSVTGVGVPAHDQPDETVYLPGHNPLLLAKALVWCRLNGARSLALGTLASNPFSDASEEFFTAFQSAMDRALLGHVELARPLAHLSKLQVMQLGRALPLEHTFSCYAPAGGRHCGRCNKCAERRAAFRVAEMVDPTEYKIQPATAGGLPLRKV